MLDILHFRLESWSSSGGTVCESCHAPKLGEFCGSILVLGCPSDRLSLKVKLFLWISYLITEIFCQNIPIDGL